MGGFGNLVVVLAALFGVYAIMFGGLHRRPGGQSKSPFRNYREVGYGVVSGAVLAMLAVGAIVQLKADIVPVWLGLVVGMLLVLGWRVSGFAMDPALALLGAAASAAALFEMVRGGDGESLSQPLRLLLGLLILVTFTLTAALARRLANFRRGMNWLCLFGLIEVVGLVANPEMELVDLDLGRFVGLMVASIALAAVLGAVAAPFIVTATALMATTASILAPLAVGGSVGRPLQLGLACALAAGCVAIGAPRR